MVFSLHCPAKPIIALKKFRKNRLWDLSDFMKKFWLLLKTIWLLFSLQNVAIFVCCGLGCRCAYDLVKFGFVNARRGGKLRKKIFFLTKKCLFGSLFSWIQNENYSFELTCVEKWWIQWFSVVFGENFWSKDTRLSLCRRHLGSLIRHSGSASSNG